MDSLWLTVGKPPWPDLRDLACLVCGQPYKVSPAYGPGYYSSYYEIVWPYRKTVRWSVNLLGASAGYALCGACSASGTGKTEPYMVRERPRGPRRTVYPDRVFWDSEGAYWNFRNWGTWAGSRSPERRRTN